MTMDNKSIPFIKYKRRSVFLSNQNRVTTDKINENKNNNINEILLLFIDIVVELF